MRVALAACLGAVLVTAGAARPALAERVAIFDLGGKGENVRVGVYLAKRMRAAAKEELARQDGSLMGWADMVKALGARNRQCITSGRCQPAVAAELGVDQVVYGLVVDKGGLTARFQLHDVKTGKVLRKAQATAERVDGLVDELPEVCKLLFRSKAELEAEKAPPPPRSDPEAAAKTPTTSDASDTQGTVITRGPFDVKGKGRIDAGQISAAVDRYLPQIHRCYGTEISNRGRSVQGSVELKLALSARGELTETKVVRNTTKAATLTLCIEKQARRWKLPRPWGGALTVLYPLELTPKPEPEPSRVASATGGDGDGTGDPEDDGLVIKNTAGTMPIDQVVSTIDKHMKQVHACYMRGVKHTPSLNGSLILEMRVKPDGHVEKAEVVDDQLGSRRVARCLMSRALTWRFPKPKGGSVGVTYPFTFSASGPSR